MRHRLFFALLPPAAARPAIGMHANECGQDRRVADARLHMTLAITRDFEAWPAEIAENLRDLGQGIRAEPIDVSLERISARGGVVVLQPARKIPRLAELQGALQAGMERRGLMRPGWTFNPHVTLTYRHGGEAFGAHVEPIGWQADEFVLIHSHVGLSRHDHLGRWPLAAVQGGLF